MAKKKGKNQRSKKKKCLVATEGPHDRAFLKALKNVLGSSRSVTIKPMGGGSGSAVFKSAEKQAKKREYTEVFVVVDKDRAPHGTPHAPNVWRKNPPSCLIVLKPKDLEGFACDLCGESLSEQNSRSRKQKCASRLFNDDQEQALNDEKKWKDWLEDQGGAEWIRQKARENKILAELLKIFE